MSNVALEVRGVSYTYGTFQALRPTTFSLEKGDALVIAGRNGAGKSTLMLCLGGLLRPATGQIAVEGHDLHESERAAKRRFAFLPDIPRFYPELTVWEHIRFIALAHGVGEGYEKRAETLLSEFDLSEARDVYPHALSRGMRLKLGILLCLIRPFTVLLMDEPTSSLDPAANEVLCRKLSALRAGGTALAITTHDPSLAAKLGGRVARMEMGVLAIE